MTTKRTILRTPALDNSSRQLFEKYVVGYVHRINNVTFKADLKDVHLDFGTTNVIPFPVINKDSSSMELPAFAFESMPKRLSRYFVLECLARLFFEEGSESFWSAIAKFEPYYESQKRQFEICFDRNVKEALFKCGEVNVSSSIWARPRIPRILVGKADSGYAREIASHCDDLIAQIKDDKNLGQSTFLNNSIEDNQTDIKSNTKSGAIPVSV